jgi:hypothetical protein
MGASEHKRARSSRTLLLNTRASEIYPRAPLNKLARRRKPCLRSLQCQMVAMAML